MKKNKERVESTSSEEKRKKKVAGKAIFVILCVFNMINVAEVSEVDTHACKGVGIYSTHES